MDLLKTRKTMAIGGAVGAGVIVLGLLAWPALVRPEPPLEATGDDGLRIKLVEPPKAAFRTAGPLDVGLSEAAQAMAKGRDALFRAPPPRPVEPAPAPRPRPAAMEVAQAEDDALPPDAADDQWRREDARRDQEDEARRRRWESEALAREAREERQAWEREMRARQRWEDRAERDRYEDLRPPPPEDRPPPERW